MKIIFLGPPYCGKGTQAKLVGEELKIPVFSMGDLILEAYKTGIQEVISGVEKYRMKGLHLPNEIKFPLLKAKLDLENGGYIIDNYPATLEDLETFLEYSKEKEIEIDKVFNINISIEEMKRRIVQRGRPDDTLEIVMMRREQQDKDRSHVISYYESKRVLQEIDGLGTVDEVHQRIMEKLK